MPNKDDAFKTHPVNFLNERTLKGTFYGNYKPRSDLPGVVEMYMNKVSSYFLSSMFVNNFQTTKNFAYLNNVFLDGQYLRLCSLTVLVV